MKTFKIHLIVFFVILSVPISFAQQNDSAAKAVLDKVSKTYSAYKTIKADFTLKGDNKQEGADYSEKGRVYLVPGSGKYKIETSSQALISNGKTQWAVLLDLGEVQITDVDPSDRSVNPSNIFDFYKRGYAMKKIGESNIGNKAHQIIELTPSDQTQNIARIQMRINKANNFIYDTTVFDKNGNRYTYTLTNIETNKTFSAGIFDFYKHNYPGIELVDLR